MTRIALLLASVLSLTMPVAPPRSPAPTPAPFFFRDGDRVVMIGDSITEQHLHSNYVEIYTVTRFPRWNVAFRNVGIGGDTSTGGNRRTARDVLSFKPTAVTITFGMNDGRYRAFEQPVFDAYIAGLQGMLDQLKPSGARVALLSTSPVEKKEDGPALEGYNQTLEQFASGVQQLAARNRALFVDQLHPHLAMLQKARGVNPANRINGGDSVHPGPPGQWLMAWAILKGLRAPALVSAADINWKTGKTTAARQCMVTNLKKSAAGVSFDRLDEAIPFTMPLEAISILKWAPILQDLDLYTLKVTGLPEGTYAIKIDGEECAGITDSELAEGFNLATVGTGPLYTQGRAIHNAVFAKNRYYHDQIFRGVVLNNAVPEAEKAALIEQRSAGMAPLEKAIRDAAVLKPHHFEVVRSTL